MNNKTKAIITAIIAGLVQVAKAAFDIEIPTMLIDAVTGILLFVAGLFIKAPEEKKS
jgi:hypothetical protein